MSFHIRNPDTDAAVRRLAASMGVSLTEAVRIAAENELQRAQPKRTESDFMKSVHEVQARLAKYPKTGRKADKAFFDWLSGEES